MLTYAETPTCAAWGFRIQLGLAAMSNDAVEAKALTLADIQRIYETEGAAAADAALRRIRLAREAREAQGIAAPSATDDIELALGDLEAAVGEPCEVIECLHELLDASDTANDRTRVASATMLAEFQRIEARKTETHDTPGGEVIETPSGEVMERSIESAIAKPEASEAERPIIPSDLESLEHLLGDLEVGAGEPAAEVIEHLEELYALAGDTPKAESSVAATPAAADGPNTATLAETAVAEEAERTDIDLNFVVADLEVGAGEIAEEVTEHLDELDASAEDAVEGAIAKAEAYEAQNVLDEARKEPTKLQEQMRAASRKYEKDAELERDRVKKQRRAKAALRQRMHRAKKARAAPKPKAAVIPASATMSSLIEREMIRKLKAWAQFNKVKRAVALRTSGEKRLKELVKAADHYGWYLDTYSEPPSVGSLAKKLRWKKRKTQQTLVTLAALYASDGPWHIRT